jgi:hypothetical protein
VDREKKLGFRSAREEIGSFTRMESMLDVSRMWMEACCRSERASAYRFDGL